MSDATPSEGSTRGDGGLSGGDGPLAEGGPQGEPGLGFDGSSAAPRAGDPGGTACTSRRIALVGILHPAYILRGQHAQERFQVEYLKRVKELLAGTYEMPTPVAVAPVGSRLDPTVDEIERYLAEVRSASVDIESAGPHITQLNFWGRGEWRTHGGLIVRFIVDGDPNPAWTWGDWQRVVRALAVWLADPRVTKSMHNGQSFDVWVLEWMGFKVAGFDWDSMLMMHIADPEARKGLEPLAVGMAGMLPWKFLAKGELEGGEGK